MIQKHHSLSLNIRFVTIIRKVFWAVTFRKRQFLQLGFKCYILGPNHHGLEISVIWLVKRSAMKLFILCVTRDKQAFRSKEISNLTLFEIRFRPLFFLTLKKKKKKDNTLKLRQYLRSFLAAFFKGNVFRTYREWNK